MVVDKNDCGKGIYRESNIIGVDGLITNQKGVTLVTFYADCVPILFFDPNKKVIASTHSGWKGTVKQISLETVNKMICEFQSQANDILIAIGPSICINCFEVGKEVVNEFEDQLPWSKAFIKATNKNKYLIDLKLIIKESLIKCGILEKNIFVSNSCTKCNKEVFFSHRGNNGITGNLGAFITLK